MNFRTTCIVAFFAALLGFGAAHAAPGDYPSKPIRMLVAFPPGGPTDNSIRIIADKLGELMGQSIVVENKSGASGNVGAQAVAHSPSDGYTFLVTSSAFAVNPSMYGAKVGYDAVKDFVPVVVVTTQPNVISVNEKVPVKTLAELRELAKNGKLSFASPGSGTTPHLTCENVFRVYWKADIVHVPYKGAGPASLAVAAGDTPIACTAAFGVFQFHKLGKVRMLAISSEKRLPNLPDVPTFIELGYPEINDYTWTTIFAPAGTPPAVVDKLNRAVNQVLAMPEYKDKLDKGGLLPVGGSPQETASYITSEIKHWTKVVSDTGAKAE
jgi:tripartite-type tricarboxylate transporter receptor subunit TctC